MCPDGNVLSAYLDGEVPLPWKEKIGSHLAVCPSCREKVNAYDRVSLILQDSPLEGEDEARERVRNRVLLHSHRPSPLEFLHRKVAVPLPLAAAVLVGIFVMGLALMQPRYIGQPDTIATLPPDISDQLAVTIKVDDMNQLLQLLSSQNRFKEVTIELPETPQFSIIGEPQFLRAAEYTRSINQ